MVNCNAGGTCNGGNPGGVYRYAYLHGVPDSTCMQYVAANLDKKSCEPMDICKDCKGPAPDVGDDGQYNCWAVNYKKYFVSSYYSIRGAD